MNLESILLLQPWSGDQETWVLFPRLSQDSWTIILHLCFSVSPWA